MHAPAVQPPPATASSITASTAPPPIRESGQRRGETWREFFARRERRNEEIKRNESSQSRGRREQRAQHARAGKAPGRKGANVFYWDELDDGHRIRTPVGYNNYQEMWSNYHGMQRRYDAFVDEWDLCTDFDPEAYSLDGDDDDDDDDDDGDNSAPRAVTTHSSNDPPKSVDAPTSRPEVEPEPEPEPEPLSADQGLKRSMKLLIAFHLKMLLKLVEVRLEFVEAIQLLEDSAEADEEVFRYHLEHVKSLAPDNGAQIHSQPEFAEAVELLQHSINTFDAGLGPDVLLYHLDYLKSLAPDDAHICREVKIISDCISWRPL